MGLHRLGREVGYGAVLVVGLPTQGSDLAMQAPGHLGVCFRLAGHLVTGRAFGLILVGDHWVTAGLQRVEERRFLRLAGLPALLFVSPWLNVQSGHRKPIGLDLLRAPGAEVGAVG